MDGRSEIRTKLLADSAVTALVGTYETLPAIFDAPLAPDKYKDAAISIYQTGVINNALNYGQYANTVNCFSKAYTTAEDLQEAVVNALNRQSQDGYFFVCSKQIIIPAGQTGEDYNAPVEVLTKTEI